MAVTFILLKIDVKHHFKPLSTNLSRYLPDVCPHTEMPSPFSNVPILNHLPFNEWDLYQSQSALYKTQIGHKEKWKFGNFWQFSHLFFFCFQFFILNIIKQIFVKKFAEKKMLWLKRALFIVKSWVGTAHIPERIDKMRYLFPDFEPLTPEKFKVSCHDRDGPKHQSYCSTFEFLCQRDDVDVFIDLFKFPAYKTINKVPWSRRPFHPHPPLIMRQGFWLVKFKNISVHTLPSSILHKKKTASQLAAFSSWSCGCFKKINKGNNFFWVKRHITPTTQDFPCIGVAGCFFAKSPSAFTRITIYLPTKWAEISMGKGMWLRKKQPERKNLIVSLDTRSICFT